MKIPSQKPGSEDTMQIAIAFVCVVAVLGVVGFVFRDQLQTAFNRLIGAPQGQPAQLRVFQPDPESTGVKKEPPSQNVFVVSKSGPPRETLPLPDLEKVSATAALFSPPVHSGAVRVKRDPQPAEVRPGIGRNEILAQFAPPSLRTSTMQNGEIVENFVYTPGSRVRPTMIILRNGAAVGIQ
jgi:hypothetical protein